MRASRALFGSLVLGTTLAAFSVPAYSDVIFSNLGPGDTYTLAVGRPVLVNPSLGQDFDAANAFIPTRDFFLDRIELALLFGDLSVRPDALDVWIMSDVAGRPGAIIEAFHFTEVPRIPFFGPLPPPLAANSALRPLLRAGSQYWLAASVPPRPNPTGGIWFQNSIGDVGLFAQRGGPGGPSWLVFNGARGAFRISGTPVPRPDLLVDLLSLKAALDRFFQGLPELGITGKALEISATAFASPPLLVPIGPVLVDLRGAYFALEGLILLYGGLQHGILNDPPSRDYQTIFQPQSYILPPSQPSTMQPLIDLYSFLEALKVTADRYTEALRASDFPSVELQRDALHVYLSEVISLASQSSAAVDTLRGLLISNNIPDVPLTLSDIASFQQELSQSGFPDPELDIFVALALDPAAIAELQDALLALQIPAGQPLPSLHGVLAETATTLQEFSQELRAVTRTVMIDIKPGDATSRVNLKRKGVIPVAILTTPAFDATTVDPLSVRFGPRGATESHGRGHIEDVDGDGDLDLMLHFRTQETGIAVGDTEACLTGQTFGGTPIRGCGA